jgi:hypothetical protein
MTQRIAGKFVPGAIPSSTTIVFHMFAGTSGRETGLLYEEHAWESRYVEVLYRRRFINHAYTAVPSYRPAVRRRSN